MNGAHQHLDAPVRQRGTSPMVIPSISPTSEHHHRERSIKENADIGSPNHASEAETEILGLTPEKKRQKRRDDEGKRDRGSQKIQDPVESVKKATTRREGSEKRSTSQSSSEKNAGRTEALVTASEQSNKTSSVPSSPSRKQRTPHLDRPTSADESVSSTRTPLERNADGSKKRKHGNERISSGEPPRQKQKPGQARSEGPPSEPRRPSIPSTATKAHRRASSVQLTLHDDQSGAKSASSTGPGRKDRDASTADSPSQPRDGYQSDSSDHSLSYHSSAPSKQRNARSQISPVRVMPQAKKRVDRFGVSIFARHCEKGDLEAAKQALEQSPDDIDVPDYAKNTPLQKAALEGHVEVVKFLISTGKCNIDNANTSQDTPLIDAVENGHLEVVRLLLAGGADPHLQNKAGSNPYDVIDNEDENSKEIMAALREAMQRDNTSRKSESGVDVGLPRSESQQNSPALPRDPSIGSIGFGRHAKLPNSILHMESTVENLRNKAAEGDQVAVYELLIRRVKPDNACGVAAARGGHEFILNLFIDKGLDMDPDPVKHDYETPMLVAIGRGHLNVVDLLLKQDGFDPTQKARRGQTYFELAEERRGPSWQKERDMLKESSDRYTQRRDRFTGKQLGSSPSSIEKVKNKTAPRREKYVSKDKSQRPPLAHSRTSSGTLAGDAADRVKIKAEGDESSKKVAGPMTQKLKRRGSEPGETAEPAERRRKLVQAKDLQKLDRRQRVLSGENDPGRDEVKKVAARSSESPKMSGRSLSDQKNKIKPKIRRLSSHGSDKRPSEHALSSPSSASVKKIKEPTQKLSEQCTSTDRPLVSGSLSKTSDRNISEAKSADRGKERRSNPDIKKEEGTLESQKKDKDLSTKILKKNQDRADDGSKPPTKSKPEESRSDKTSAAKIANEKQLPRKEASEKKVHDNTSSKDGIPKDQTAKKVERGNRLIVNEKDNGPDGGGKEEQDSNPPIKDRSKDIPQKDVIQQDREKKEHLGKERVERERQERERKERELLEKERADRVEKERVEKERLEKEHEEKERIEKKRLHEEKQEKERLERERLERVRIEERLKKERLEKEQQEKERLRKEREEKERTEKERLEREEREKVRQEEERRKREQMEAERLRKAEDERKALERSKYLDTLPPSLHQALQLGPDLLLHSKNGKLSVSSHFLPLYVVRLVEIDPDCPGDQRQDPWILNFQAAVVLGHHDMKLNQHPSWPRKDMTSDQRRYFLEGYDVADLALPHRHPPHSDAPYDPSALLHAVESAKAQFMTMEPLFWVRLKDFLQVVLQYPRLKGVKMSTLSICHVDYVDDPQFGLSRKDVLEFKRDRSRLDIIRKVSSQNLKPCVYINGIQEQANGSH